MTRLLVAAALAALVYVLLHTSVTVPALPLAGLAVWAVFATVVACAPRTPPRPLRRYRTPAGVLS